MDKQLPEMEITNAPKTPIFEKTTFTFQFRVKGSQSKREFSSLLRKPPSLTYSWRLDYKKWFSPPLNAVVQPLSPPPETSVLLNAEDLTVGMHRFQVRIEDKDGNIGPSAVALFKVIPDLQPPETKITTKVLDIIKSVNEVNHLPPCPFASLPLCLLEFEGNDPQTPKEKLQYSWRIDLGKWSEFSFQTSVYLPNLVEGVVANASHAKDGVHSFEVKAKDESGNEDTTPAKVLFEVARQEPDTMIWEGVSQASHAIEPPEIIEASDVTFRFSGTDLQTPREKLEYSWRLDNQKWTPFSTKTIVELTNLSNGMHQFGVKARDEDKNEDSSPVKVVFKVAVNIELPETEIINPPAEPNKTSDGMHLNAEGVTASQGVAEGVTASPQILLPSIPPQIPLPSIPPQIPVQPSWADGRQPSWSTTVADPRKPASGVGELTGAGCPTPAEAQFEVAIDFPEADIINAPIVPLESADSTSHFESAETQTPEGKRARGQEGKGARGQEGLDTTPAEVVFNGKAFHKHRTLVSASRTDLSAVPSSGGAGVGTAQAGGFALRAISGESEVEGVVERIAPSRKPAGEGVVSTHRHKPASGVGELTLGVGALTTAFSERLPRTYIKTNHGKAFHKHRTLKKVRKAEIEIEFYGEDKQTPYELVYAWKLDDDDWSEFSKDTTVRLKNLSNGPHTFRVKAKNPQGNEDPSPPKYIFIVDLPVSRNLIVVVTLFILPALSAGYYLFYRWRQRQPRIIAAKIYPKLKKNLQIVLSVMYEICERQAAIKRGSATALSTEIFQHLFKEAMKKNAPQIAVAADIFAAILSKVPIDGLSERIQGLATLGGAEAEAFHGYLLNLSEAAEANAISEISIQGRFLLQRISEPSFPDFILKNSEKVLEKMKELLEHLSNFERRGDACERLIYLEKANDFCNQARVLVEQQLAQPDKTLFNFLFTQWMRAISATREKMVFFIGKVDVLL